jgi:hypothetical protein
MRKAQSLCRNYSKPAWNLYMERSYELQCEFLKAWSYSMLDWVGCIWGGGRKPHWWPSNLHPQFPFVIGWSFVIITLAFHFLMLLFPLSLKSWKCYINNIKVWSAFPWIMITLPLSQKRLHSISTVVWHNRHKTRYLGFTLSETLPHLICTATCNQIVIPFYRWRPTLLNGIASNTVGDT